VNHQKTDDPHRPLRQDIRLLGQTLGNVLIEQKGRPFFQHVETIRSLTKKARSKSSGDISKQVHRYLVKLPVEEMTSIARAFSIFLSLANIAEQHHRIRRTRLYKIQKPNKQHRASMESVFPYLLSKGVGREELYNTIKNLGIELVLTSHPSEITRRTFFEKYRRIDQILAELDRTEGSTERKKFTLALHREITAIWLTDEVREFKPTPVDEAELGLLVMENTLWKVVPDFFRHVAEMTKEHCRQDLPLDCCPITFGSWMGGDRDGNPYVTHKVTKRVHFLTRKAAAELYLKEVQKLYTDLSMSRANKKNNGNGQSISESLQRNTRSSQRSAEGDGFAF